jgi:hypothetical protein
LAALSSSINTSSKPKSPQSQSRPGQGSQRAAAVAALSNVLTAEGSTLSPRIGMLSELQMKLVDLYFPFSLTFNYKDSVNT